MYLERLLAENVRHLAAVEQVFSDGPQQIRRWTLLSAGAAATARLRCLALVSLGRWQMSRLAGRVLPLLAADMHRPVRVEFVLIRHAPQERGLHSPSRHHQGWQILAGGSWEALARRTLIHFIVAADVSRLKLPPRRNNERTDVRCYVWICHCPVPKRQRAGALQDATRSSPRPEFVSVPVLARLS